MTTQETPKRHRRTKAEMEAARAAQAASQKPAAPKKEAKDEKVTSYQIVSAEPQQKFVVDKKNLPPEHKLPRITISEWDEKGRMISKTFVCEPTSLKISRNEDVSYTTGGKAKKTLWINIESNVVEIE